MEGVWNETMGVVDCRWWCWWFGVGRDVDVDVVVGVDVEVGIVLGCGGFGCGLSLDVFGRKGLSAMDVMSMTDVLMGGLDEMELVYDVRRDEEEVEECSGVNVRLHLLRLCFAFALAVVVGWID